MNKNIKGLIVYLLLMSIIWTFPFLTLLSFLAAYSVSDDGNEPLANLFLILAGVVLILYFILPILLTYFAIKKHWSKYLDRFFLHKWWPTILLLFFIFLHSTEHIFHYISSSDKFLTSCICLIAIISEVFIAPTYYFTYLNLLIFRKKLRKFAEQKTPEK